MQFIRSSFVPRMKSPSTARRAFGFSGHGELVRAVPRSRFLFFTEFVLSDAGKQMTSNANLNTYDGNRGLAFKVRQIDKPKINLLTSDLNQYNKKKVVYTKTEYSEATIRIFDTVDDSVLATWIDYFTYYFGDSRVKSDQTAYSQSPVSSRFTYDSGWGLIPLGPSTQFFDRIRLLAFYARTYTAFSYINPKITSIDWQSYDYSSTELAEISINFKYESIKYEAFGQPYDPQTYGWLPTDALDLSQASVQTQRPSPPIPRIFGGLDISPEINTAVESGFSLPTDDQEDAAEIQRFFSQAPGAEVPTRASPPVDYIGGVIEPSFGEPAATPAVPSRQSVRDSAAVAAARRRVFGESLEERQARRNANDASGRQAAIDQGLIPADSDSSVEGIVTGGVPVAVRIDGQLRELSLTPEQEVRVARARSMIRSSSFNTQNLNDI